MFSCKFITLFQIYQELQNQMKKEAIRMEKDSYHTDQRMPRLAWGIAEGSLCLIIGKCGENDQKKVS